jgi:MFS family permease
VAHAEDAHPTLRQTFRELPRSAVVLLVGVAINRMGSLLQIFLVLYLTDLGFSPSKAGLVLAVYGVGSILGDFVGGAVSDTIGPRRAIMVSMVGAAVFIGALGHVHDYGVIVGLALVIGVVTHLYWPAALAMLAVLAPAGRLVIASAAFRLALNVGATLAPLIGVYLSHRSYTWVFMTDAVTSLAFAVVALFKLPDARPEPEEEQEAEEGVPAAEAGRRGGYRAVFADRRFLVVVAAALAVGLVEVQYLSVLPLEIEASGFSTTLYAVVLAINGAMVIGLELPLTPFILKVPMRTTIAAGSALIGFGLSLFGLPAGAWLFVLGAVVWTAGEIVSTPSITAYPALVARPDLRGRYIGALGTAQTVGYAVGPVIGTTLFEAVGSSMWLLCVVLGAVGGFGMWLGVVEPARSAGRPAPSPTDGDAGPAIAVADRQADRPE